MSYWNRISPRGAIGDLINEWRKPNPHRWGVLGVSIAATASMFIVLIPDSTRIPPAQPQVTYITSFAPDRTDAEIATSNEANQARKEQRAAEAAVRAERRRENFRALGRASGFDVDALERQFSEQPGQGAARQPQGAGGE